MGKSKLEATVEDRLKKESGLPAWEVEYRFDEPPAGTDEAPRKWRFDFAWPAYKVAVAVEGGTWVRGSHVRGKRFAKDCEKYNSAALAGWIVLRWPTDAIKGRWDKCLAELKEALSIRRQDAI
jgi:very-short-patch-repair endonuclease